MNVDDNDSLLRFVRRYLAEHYVPPAPPPNPFFPFYLGAASAVPPSVRAVLRTDTLTPASKNVLFRSIQDMLQPGFRELLFDMMQEKGLSAVDLYQRADLTKGHFSKIKTDEHYHPSKETVLALALGLRLTLEETLQLLERAGYTLTDSSPTDVIVKCFIEIELFDVRKLNAILDAFGLSTITNYKRPRTM
ncbi:helix-turn-helix domain-containing protein [uncultured Selenomonas sp.]|uniref:helix-turn-helix domain-containing protein n=1 Tax=uncultured Selenomonas sp. TaxID=159275 RepID=UPI0025FA5347|nr:helix-turn-helix domain-containing protein [uncultured Selenomonas sp.]